MPPEEFRRFFAPRLQFFLQNLEGHHQIEDQHFFPLFRAAEKRLVKGFDVLESDHEAIHAEIIRTVESANGLLRTMESDDDARRKATDAYADASERLLKFLVRHLDDEEDLIMPVILDQGERKLFGMELRIRPHDGGGRGAMTTRQASCSCGQLSVTCEGEPVRISICHCNACQKRTGSVFGTQARFPREQVTIEGRSTQ